MLSSQWMLQPDVDSGHTVVQRQAVSMAELRAAHAQRSSMISTGYMQASTSYTQGTGNALRVSSSRRKSGRVVLFALPLIPTSTHTRFGRAPNGVCCCVVSSTLATVGKHEARSLLVAKAQACSTHTCCGVSQHKSAKTSNPTHNCVYPFCNKHGTVILQTRVPSATAQDCSQRSLTAPTSSNT